MQDCILYPRVVVRRVRKKSTGNSAIKIDRYFNLIRKNKEKGNETKKYKNFNSEKFIMFKRENEKS